MASLLTSSGPNEVVIQIGSQCVSDTPEKAMSSAWCILDSAKRAFEKSYHRVPRELEDALQALSGWAPPF